ncbi:hypothetical protein [Thioalkalivibrio thiocyanoxidans]|uniref:hypothetical protein n=1 Tax=Thioalkalivibrio thiocyanoxidans TaxID=152475 RepID=UPI0012DFD4CE|nr:hypothetical protein [Thioalkalivibrio thiocyanoxidans]
MKSAENFPTAENIPDLSGNIEGLKRHSFMCVFAPEPTLSPDDRRIRAWLLHTIISASRHYTRARELVELQDNADQSRDGGAIFHILDVSEQIEDCVAATYRACMAIRRLDSCQEARKFSSNFHTSIEDLRLVRNQFDHMHSQVTAAETGGGPISIVFGDEGKSIKFRKLSMGTLSLNALLDGAYRVVASLYPAFDVNSKKEAGGPIKLTMSASVTVTDADGNTR